MRMKKKLNNINLIFRNKKVRYLTFVGLLSRILYFKCYKGFDIFSEYWDYLIILDACRFDLFAEEISKRRINGKLEYRISRGSMTEEFLINNFSKGHFPNIVYVTANPFTDLLLKNKFYKIIPVWKFGWDDELKTVHPKKVYKYALEAKKRYPDKKLIIHFMQPHYPFITIKSKNETGISQMVNAINSGKKYWVDIDIWDLFFDKMISIEEIIDGYRSNLKIVMDYVEELIQYLDGKIVITSDHGEAFGEKLHPLIPIRVYGHPKRTKIDALVKVPWFIIEKERKLKHSEEITKLKRAISKAVSRGGI